MFLKGKEIKPYAEPLPSAGLKEGATYFFLNFVDDEMLLPILEPFVFIGRNLEAGDSERVYFQDASSFQLGIRYETTDEGNPATFYAGSEHELSHVFEYDQALDALMACSLRRRKSLRQ
jgi:hypothetical protein